MSPKSKHQGLGSPAASIGSHPESFGPLSQYHPSKYQSQQQSQNHEQIVSPLITRFSPTHVNHSPTQGYLSPISLVSPVLSVPSEPLHRDNSIRETARPASSSSSSSQRPRTLYLADHQPHRLATKPLPPVPAAVVKTKHHNNNIIPNPNRHRRDNDRIAQNVDIEMQDINLNDNHTTTTTAPITNTNTTLPLTKFDRQLEDGTYEAKRRRRHWIIIVLTVLLLGGASAAFAVLAVKGTSTKVEITPG